MSSKRKLDEAFGTDGSVEKSESKKGKKDNGDKKKSRRVRFEDVTLFYFERSQGFSCVPTRGGACLSMEDHHHLVRRVSLPQHERELQESHYKHVRVKNADNKLGSEADETTSVEGATTSETGATPEVPLVAPSEELSTSDEDSLCDEEDDEDEVVQDEADVDENGEYVLQPLGSKQRKQLLRTAGVADLDKGDTLDCREIRRSREVCGCNCPDNECLPETCSCARDEIKCQVDRLSFPCNCTRAGCQNPSGRVEFDPLRVRTHYFHTMMRLRLEESQAVDTRTVASPSHVRFSAEENSYCDEMPSGGRNLAASDSFVADGGLQLQDNATIECDLYSVNLPTLDARMANGVCVDADQMAARSSLDEVSAGFNPTDAGSCLGLANQANASSFGYGGREVASTVDSCFTGSSYDDFLRSIYGGSSSSNASYAAPQNIPASGGTSAVSFDDRVKHASAAAYGSFYAAGFPPPYASGSSQSRPSGIYGNPAPTDAASAGIPPSLDTNNSSDSGFEDHLAMPNEWPITLQQDHHHQPISDSMTSSDSSDSSGSAGQQPAEADGRIAARKNDAAAAECGMLCVEVTAANHTAATSPHQNSSPGTLGAVLKTSICETAMA